MLIKSDRHTYADVCQWQQLEAADAAAFHQDGLRRLEHRARDAIISFCDRPCHGAVSWGKDSVTLAHLLWMHTRHVPLVHIRSSTHNPDCDAVRDEYFLRFPGQQYEEVHVSYRGGTQAENEKRWTATARSVNDRFGGRYLLGIRRDESTVRKMRFMVHGLTSGTSCGPIGWWKESHVFAYLHGNGLPVHPAYACLGGGRWPRGRLRVDELGDIRGDKMGRAEWEQEYYGAELRRIEVSE